MHILGVSAMYHDAAAAVVTDGTLVAAAQQERFSRIKHDPAVPIDAMAAVLEQAGVGPDGLDAIVYYEKPLTSFGRVLRSYVAAGPRGLRTFPATMADWGRRKLWAGLEIEKALAQLGYRPPRRRVLYAEHHVSHAASAFFPSPFESACVLTFDGVGEWATSSIGHGSANRIQLLEELRFPSSLGLLYSTFTLAAGFRVNGGEYKLMGLAPFGRPVYEDAIRRHLLNLHADGSFSLDLSYFGFVDGKRMTNERFASLFGPDRVPDSPITQRDCDLARSVQVVLEDIVLRMAVHAQRLTGERRVVLAGGVALNGVANGRLVTDGPFDEVWVQPAAGDAGSAVGCALWAWHEVFGGERTVQPGDGMGGALLGPTIDPDAVEADLAAAGRPAERIAAEADRAARVADLLAGGAVVAVCQGPMEFGPRALGNRSILADPRGTNVQRDLNARVKRRESFRPFAPAVLDERADEWFEISAPSPYMSLVVPVRGAEVPELDTDADPAAVVDLGQILDAVRSPLPAVTHADGTARVQTVDRGRAPWMHALLEAFDRRTGCPVLLNTSFNVRGEPIVSSASDAYRCFMHTDIDWLLLGESLLEKTAQPVWTGPALDVVPD
jgi:carbamoyltransferase